MTFNTLLFVSEDLYTKPLESWGDRISLSGEMLLRGMGTIFFVLALLWGILELFKFFAYTLPQKRSGETPAPTKPVKEKPVKEKPVKAKPAVKAAAPAPAVPTAPAQHQDLELVAAITAAIAAYLDQPTTSFRVVSFKRTGRKK